MFVFAVILFLVSLMVWDLVTWKERSGLNGPDIYTNDTYEPNINQQ